MRQVSAKQAERLEELDRARQLAKFRDGNECQARKRGLVPPYTCQGIIHVHHIVPRSRSRAVYADLSNLVCLCEEHHIGLTGVHRDGRSWAVEAGLVDYEPGDTVDD